MVNTITLSTDMKTLYLIDDERAIPFDLTKGNGVLVGTLFGQITVATAISSKGTPGGKGTKMNEKTLELKGSQWTLMYNSPNELLHVIGEVEIEFFRPTGKEPRCEDLTIDIKNEIINIKRVGESIQISTVKTASKGV